MGRAILCKCCGAAVQSPSQSELGIGKCDKCLTHVYDLAEGWPCKSR